TTYCPYHFAIEQQFGPVTRCRCDSADDDGGMGTILRQRFGPERRGDEPASRPYHTTHPVAAADRRDVFRGARIAVALQPVAGGEPVLGRTHKGQPPILTADRNGPPITGDQ